MGQIQGEARSHAMTWRRIGKAQRRATSTRAITDRLAPQARRQFLAAISALENQVDLDALVQAIRDRAPEAIDRILGLAQLPKRLQNAVAVILTAFEKAGLTTASQLGQSLGVTFRFDLVNPAAVNWTRRYGAEFVTGIGTQARTMIREVIAAGIERGIPPADTARLLRAGIGLTDRQAMAVINYRFDLLEAGRTIEDVARLAERYARQLLNHRAKLIARHETVLASNVGQMQAWRQAVQAGLIQPARTRRRWSAASDERVCPICEPMDGQEVAFEGEPFITGEGDAVEMPPAHVACRCSMGLVFVTTGA